MGAVTAIMYGDRDPSIAGMVLTVITKFFPGHVDDLAVILAQPAILNAVESARGVLKSIFISKDNGQINAALVDFKGNVQDISIKDSNLAETVRKDADIKIGNDKEGMVK